MRYVNLISLIIFSSSPNSTWAIESEATYIAFAETRVCVRCPVFTWLTSIKVSMAEYASSKTLSDFDVGCCNLIISTAGTKYSEYESGLNDSDTGSSV